MEFRKGQLGRRIEFYTHPKYGGKIPIYLDGAGQFSAVIGDVVLHATELKKIKDLTDETLKNQTNLEWLPVIEISFGYRWHHGDDDRNDVSKENTLQFKRYWIARKIDGKWIQASWDTETYPDMKKKIETGDRLERSKSFNLQVYHRATHQHCDVDIKLPYTHKGDDRGDTPTYYVAYEEALWIALQELAKRMDQLQISIMKLLGSSEKRAALAAQVQKLLPANSE